MKAAHDADSASVPHHTTEEAESCDAVWLELSSGGKVHTYEFESREIRAITVGSHSRADLRIVRTGVAPVQFHVEHEAGHLWLVPAYGSEALRVNTARIAGPKRMNGRMVIEFCGVRIQARVFDAATRFSEGSSARRRSIDLAACLRQRSSGEEPAIAPNPTSRLQTNEISPTTVKLQQLAAPTEPEQATVPLWPTSSSDAIPVQRTVVIEPIHVIPLGLTVQGPPVSSGAGEGQANRLNSSSQANPINDTVQLDPFWLRDLDGRLSSGGSIGTQCTTVSDVPRIAPTRTASYQWFTRLGLLARRRPWTVWLVGVTSAFILSASVVFVTTHVRRIGQSRATRSIPVASASSHPAPELVASAASVSSAGPDSVLIVPAVPPLTRSAAVKGKASDPELAAATGHIVSGRYKDAQQAYTALATQAPGDRSLLVVSRLLAKKTAPECSSSPTAVSCPEMKP